MRNPARPRFPPPGRDSRMAWSMSRGGWFPRWIPTWPACDLPADFAARLPVQDQAPARWARAQGFTPGTVAALFGTLRRLRPDVIHTHNPGTVDRCGLGHGCRRPDPILHGEHEGQIQQQVAQRAPSLAATVRRIAAARACTRCSIASMISALAAERPARRMGMNGDSRNGAERRPSLPARLQDRRARLPLRLPGSRPWSSASWAGLWP